VSYLPSLTHFSSSRSLILILRTPFLRLQTHTPRYPNLVVHEGHFRNSLEHVSRFLVLGLEHEHGAQSKHGGAEFFVLLQHIHLEGGDERRSEERDEERKVYNTMMAETVAEV